MVSNHIAAEASIAELLTTEWLDLPSLVQRMGMVSADRSALAWRGERVAKVLPGVGQQLLDGLLLAVNGGVWPQAALTPPATTGAEPVHRLWVPIALSETLPWEAACESAGLAIFCDTRFSLTYRHLPIPSRDTPSLEVAPLKVLVATAMPQGMPSANVELQRGAMDRAVENHGQKASTNLRWFTHHDLSVVRNEIVMGGYNGLHVVAHGLPGRILWFDEQSRPVWYTAREFVEALAGIPLTMALWMVCHSGSGLDDTPSLLRASLDRLSLCAVAMRSVVDDVAAAQFAAGYYSALFSGGPIALEGAVTRGRSMVSKACRSGVAFPGQWASPMVAFRDRPLVVMASKQSISEAKVARAVFDEQRDGASLQRTRSVLILGDGRHYLLTTKRVRIGRSRSADLVLNGAAVAPFHATLIQEGEHWRIVDDRSGLPTFVNGIATTDADLNVGDRLTIGDQEIVLNERRISRD